MQVGPWDLVTEKTTERLAQAMANVTSGGMVMHLHGDLGAGKTTLIRAYLRALGHHGSVKSPTYTLVEPYALPQGIAYHFDLFRLHDPEELELMGVRDYFSSNNLCLVEWPERASSLLGVPDIDAWLSLVHHGRQIAWASGSERGEAWLKNLAETWEMA
ncbi:MAG: tRNA (adenosine(37)-N6)-threonylcarbamoyltransferase complex ATPase subunit type 1 TsaE [Pseudomonadales bacterium]|nr:tRNA (adenosine(37)-N6)-threonylcarbamoyltransferase complex ATPase subunit type 1 TsaE [Pseudomonadales bacterium]